jgi:hypothetical protein
MPVQIRKSKMFKNDLYDHPLVVRLRKNPNWKPAVDAAVDYFIEGKEYPIVSFKRSSTWAQVRFAYEELRSRPAPTSWPHG